MGLFPKPSDHTLYVDSCNSLKSTSTSLAAKLKLLKELQNDAQQ